MIGPTGNHGRTKEAPLNADPDAEGTDHAGHAGDLLHGMRWGIKESFVEYVRRMPDGRGSVSSGAIPVGTGDLFYEYDTQASGAATDGRTIWAFRGDVQFTGHFGMLFVRVARPHLELSDGTALLTIEDPQGREGAPRIRLVTATLEHVATREGTEVWRSDDVALTAEGVALFNNVYAEGERFERIVVQIPQRARVAEEPAGA